MEAHENKYSILGKRVPRVDTRLKVQGKAKYAADYEMPGMLWGKIKRAPYAHARILSIDTSKAERLPGVKGVVVGKDFGNFKWGWQGHTRDESPLATDKVRYLYEGVAAVAAIDKDIAEEACDLIDIEYEELPGVFDPFEAMKEGAPLVHENKPRNILVEYHWDFGNVDKAFDESYLVKEELFQTPRMAKGYIEPPSALAWWEHDTLHYLGSKGSPYMLWRIFGRAFNLPLSKVRVITPVIGCDFGGTKNDGHALDFAAILLAKKTGRPVKIVYTQWEELTTCLRRHPMWMRTKIGLSRDGIIKGLYTNVVADGGAYARMSPVSMYLTNGFVTLPYKFDNFKTDTWNIYTNNPMSAAMRGHGMYHTRYAIDCLLDMMAKELGIDPVEIRLKNCLDDIKAGETYYTVNKLRVASCGVKECLTQSRDLFGWDDYHKNTKKVDGHIARGAGVSCTGYLSGARLTGHNSCSALVRINEDGSVNVQTGATDVGMGSDTAMCMIAAEVLGLQMSDVEIKRVDTSYSYPDPGSYGSRVTIYAGEATARAAEDAKKQILEAAAKEMGLFPEELDIKDRKVIMKTDETKFMPWLQAVRIACYASIGNVIVGKGVSRKGTQGFSPKAFETGVGDVGTNYGFAAQINEVEVDLETGVVKCTEKSSMADDCGFPLNPDIVETQCIGGSYHQAIAPGLYEEFYMDNGSTLNPNFVDYKRPRAYEAPFPKFAHVITHDPFGPFGVKECSEATNCTGAPAVISAIYDATGVMIKNMPATPEKMWRALRAKKEEAKK
ncbi:MAG: 4-hydroxybenzoyl-CoA reductase subunit alpha [Syntrophorhabdaceae bacterium PtaU1.Bin034]|nr:MAG: 4-hydroxybenzoyl-CoA reductase subunit alpha [Syntrophorhabdaceae bacterium PtaU1.Bin034]